MSEKPPQDPTPDEHLDERLDEALDETFPASDPIAVHEPRRPPPRAVSAPPSQDEPRTGTSEAPPKR